MDQISIAFRNVTLLFYSMSQIVYILLNLFQAPLIEAANES